MSLLKRLQTKVIRYSAATVISEIPLLVRVEKDRFALDIPFMSEILHMTSGFAYILGFFCTSEGHHAKVDAKQRANSEHSPLNPQNGSDLVKSSHFL